MGAVALAFPYARQRLALSLAKHPSLTGHSRMAKRVGSWLPGYAFDEQRFFDCDGASETIAQTRRKAFDELAQTLQTRHAKSLALTAQAREGIADLQFRGAYRGPFQVSPLVRQHLKVGAFIQSADGVCVADVDGQRLYDLTGSYGVNVFGAHF